MPRFEFKISAFVIIFLGFPCGLMAYDEHIRDSPVDIKYPSEIVNEKKVDDIFNLLADIDPKSERRFKPEAEHKNVEQNLVRKQISNAFKPPMNKSHPSTLKRYLEILNTISKTSLIKSKTVENVLDTVNKVTRIYEGEKKRLSDKIDNEIDQGTRSPNQTSSTDGVMKSTAKIAQYLLKPPNMKKVFEISSRAKDEDEILEQLTSVILGAEERSGGGYGSGLTLDPVTCIALLTLAAYLIRAVFQILTLNNTPRQFRDSSLGSFNVFDGAVRILSLLDEDFPPFATSARRNSQETDKITDSWLKGTTALALFLKINMDNQHSCLEKVICTQVSGKSLKDFGVSEAFWSAAGIYNGGLHKWLDYLSGNYGQNVCESVSNACPENMREQYSCPSCSPAKLKEYINWQNWMDRLLRNFSEFFHSVFILGKN